MLQTPGNLKFFRVFEITDGNITSFWRYTWEEVTGLGEHANMLQGGARISAGQAWLGKEKPHLLLRGDTIAIGTTSWSP